LSLRGRPGVGYVVVVEGSCVGMQPLWEDERTRTEVVLGCGGGDLMAM
jgi:hypothetical protein